MYVRRTIVGTTREWQREVERYVQGELFQIPSIPLLCFDLEVIGVSRFF